MTVPEPTVDGLRASLGPALEALAEAYVPEGQGAPAAGESTPELLAQAFRQLFEAMQRTEASAGQAQPLQPGHRASTADVSELGEYALELFEHGLGWARQLDLPEAHDALQRCVVAMGRWIARHGGELFTLEPIVDAVAGRANQVRDPQQLIPLYHAMGEIMDAAAPAIRQDLEKANPGRPWRILHLNRAIVATRTHRPSLMEEAFSRLTRDLPEEAAQFFSQGMEQMDLLNYPPQVRAVMDRYYREWSVSRSLH
ncbi:MAG: hypothetical protein PVI91_09530 [Gammaproteobacteria bacterium]|jgi:hypothetical protein